jgi:urease accessory protein
VTLSFSDRFRRRIRLSLDDGQPFMLDLREVTQLDHGSALLVAGEGEIDVRAAVEAVIVVSSEDPARLVRWAWHLGNRHLPVEFIGTTGLRIAADPVIADMLQGLGAKPVFTAAPFAPEGGAYGGGPTYGHDHSHSHSHSHSHGHSHADRGEGGDEH